MNISQSSSKAQEQPNSRTWILLLIVMVPQLGLTLVNPSNMAIAADLSTGLSQVEATLTVYMVGYAVSMFVSGTLADRFDATRLQAAGLLLFVVGCVVAALAPTVLVLAVGRFLQALGGTSATVLTRIIVQRRYPASARVGVLTSMSMVISLTPSLSPLAGGLLSEIMPWRVLFVLLAVFAVCLIPMIMLLLGAAAPEHPVLPSPKQFMGALANALGNKKFLWNAAAISFVWMTYFGFINSSTTILQGLLGQSEIRYGVFMAIPAIGYLAGSLLVKKARDIVAVLRVVMVIGALGIGAAFLGAWGGVVNNPGVLVGIMAVVFLGVGATIPFTQANLLELDVAYPGVAAGLFFFLQMASGAAYGTVVRALDLGTVASFVMVLMVPQIIVTAMVLGARRRQA
ncbi:MFS transporter [Corynebacterium sp. sy017]|uniref:MFS transporter n=1 Tax=unclassified Corynebacterium TaxID=2624378 RepID=UPI0011862C4E|nr:MULTISPECIES: MFS transporter [unclassified Corynebacterium]MBP3089088.1 MFS transporter [Corynebacterium sp. sy017]TSD91403.1 MFS transporter [Corynebacterium sp. SY003]